MQTRLTVTTFTILQSIESKLLPKPRKRQIHSPIRQWNQEHSGAQMSSQRRINASRANRSLSNGPKTDSGKARSSLNGIKHGAYAKSIVLPTESAARFNKLRADYTRALRPANEIQRDLMEESIIYRWFTRRLWALGSTSVTDKMDEQKDQVQPKHVPLPEPFRTAIAHWDLYDSGQALPYIQRSQARNLRLFLKALSHLYEVRRAQKSENEQKNLVPNSDTPPQRQCALALFSNARPLLRPRATHAEDESRRDHCLQRDICRVSSQLTVEFVRSRDQGRARFQNHALPVQPSPGRYNRHG